MLAKILNSRKTVVLRLEWTLNFPAKTASQRDVWTEAPGVLSKETILSHLRASNERTQVFILTCFFIQANVSGDGIDPADQRCIKRRRASLLGNSGL